MDSPKPEMQNSSGHPWLLGYVEECEIHPRPVITETCFIFLWRRDVREEFCCPSTFKDYHVGKNVLPLAAPQRFQGHQVFQSETQLSWQFTLPLPISAVGK